MFRFLIVCSLSIVLSGCATRGALRIDCPGFRQMATELPPSPLVRDIQSDVGELGLQDGRDLLTAESPLAQAMDRTADRAAERRTVRLDRGPSGTDVLMLSGGGQWGAFGAGFLERLHESKVGELPRPGVITGVSTGALQALILASNRDDKYAYLRGRYQPASESEIVDRGPQPLAAITGSIAGLRPLRRRIEAVLCTGGDPRLGCPAIEALSAHEAPEAFIGFVEASSGKFLYADVRGLARLAQSRQDVGGMRKAQQCLTGAALASVAMPVFFQQVRVDGKTYYDGGVRHSVFEAEAARQAQRAALRVAERRYREEAGASGKRLSAPEGLALTKSLIEESSPDIYVLRNGPTTVVPNSKVDRKADALSNALRAEPIIVNELEVSSIAEIRLGHPTGTIRLITADGYDSLGGCHKQRQEEMFSPDFMQCLILLGRRRADEDHPWRSLREISSGEAAAQNLLDRVAR